MKVDLSVASHFYSPQSGKKVPYLSDIVSGLAKKDLDVVGIMSCHTRTSGIDTRWKDYMGQEIGKEWERTADDSRGVVQLNNKEKDRKLTLIHTQKVRAYDGEKPIDLLVFGLDRIIEPGREFTETARDAKSTGGFSLVVDPETTTGLDFNKTYHLICEEGLIQGVQLSATNPRKYTTTMLGRLADAGIRAVPVSNAKRFKDARTSYIEIECAAFSFEKLGNAILEGHFNPHYGQISKWQTFASRDRHIYASMIGQFLAGGKIREEMLRAIGLKK